MGAWLVDFTIGTPAQTLSLEVDTGSSDIWVNARTSQFCLEGHCILGGSYDSDSKSKKIVSNDFSIQYVDKSAASGQFVSDSMYFDHKLVPDVQFGLAFVSNIDPGMFGLGYDRNEAQAPLGQEKYYPSFGQTLVDRGMINVKAFSMWMIDDDMGVLLFGGVDRLHYNGELKTVPIIPSDDGGFIDFQIQVHKISVSQGKDEMALSLSVPFATTALLDSGCNTLNVPPKMATDIYKFLEAETLADDDNYFVRCTIADSSPVTFDFTLDANTIRIPLKSFILPWFGDLQPKAGDRLCHLAIRGQEGEYVLGIPFLRNVYVVYDLDHNEISLAPVKRGVYDSDIIELAADENISQSFDGFLTSQTTKPGNQV